MSRTPTDHPAAECPDWFRGWGRVGILLASASVVLLAGCRPNKRYDTIEAELRTRDKELAATRAELERSRNLNRAYEQGQSRAPELPGGPAVPQGGGGAPGCTIREVVLGRGTGGIDDDGLPGDEALMVVIVPRDEDRSEVKVTARAQVAAWEISPQGLKNLIGNWDIPPDRLRPTWRNGLMSTGYFVALPWQQFPTTERVRVAVRLTTLDGQVFETDRDISVRPVPQALPRGGPATVPGPAPGGPPPAGGTPGSPPPLGREPLYPGTPPPGVPPAVPPGTEELPPPKGLGTGRSAGLGPPVKQ